MGCGSRARERAAMCPSPSPPPLLPHWQFSGRQNPGGPIERTSELFSCDPRNTAGFFVVVAGFFFFCPSALNKHPPDQCAGGGRWGDPRPPLPPQTAPPIRDGRWDNNPGAPL